MLRLGAETRIAGLLIVELAIIYFARIMLRRILNTSPFSDDQVAALFAYLGSLVVIGWASAINIDLFIPLDTNSNNFWHITYVGACILFGMYMISVGTKFDMTE